jgi:hypothetical protein
VEQTLRSAFRSGETVKLRPFRVRHQDGRWVWYECTGLSYRRADGERRFLAVGARFLRSPSRREERRALELRMQQGSGSRASACSRAGSRTTSTTCSRRSSASPARAPRSARALPMRERLERILRAAQRAADLTRKMLANVGAETLRTDRVRVSQLVDEMAHLVGDSAPEGVAIRYELTKGLPSIEGDVTQIGQVIMNLVTNALESLGSGPGSVAIRTGETLLDQQSRVRCPASARRSAGPLRLPRGRGLGLRDVARHARAHLRPVLHHEVHGRGLGLAAVLGSCAATRAASRSTPELGAARASACCSRASGARA